MKGKIETGVIVMKNDKAWGIIYEDGRCTEYGWTDPINAIIHDPKFCKEPKDVTYKNSPYFKDLLGAQLIKVRRITEIKFD
jgi:hypothetical protein